MNLLWLGAAAVGAFTGYLAGGALWAIVGAFLFGAGWAAFEFTAREARRSATELSLDNVSLHSRPRLVPLFKLRGKILDQLTSNRDNPVVIVTSSEIKSEVDTTVRRAVDLAEACNKLRRLENENYSASRSAESLRVRTEHGKTSDHTVSDVRAAEETGREIGRLITRSREDLEAHLAEAESALSVLHSKLTMVVSESVSARAQADDPVSDLTARLKVISKTMEDSANELRVGVGWDESR